MVLHQTHVVYLSNFTDICGTENREKSFLIAHFILKTLFLTSYRQP